MPSLEESFEAACSSGKIPGAVLLATDKTGSFTYARAFGFKSLEEGQEKPLEKDAVMALASCTKLVTTIAALQCVEHGLVGLDDDVAGTLPELARQEILTGMDPALGTTIMKRRKNLITLRHLLTHSSGIIYDAMSPLHQKYHTHFNKPPINSGSTILTRLAEPLLFEPGRSWHYGSGIDWAGLLVERLTGSNLEDYMREHIWNPLEIKDMTFWPDQHPEIKANMTGMSIRDPSIGDGKGKVGPYNGPGLFDDMTDPMGGQGAYTAMPSYLKILHSILVDDGKLLQAETSAMMFEPQLTRESQQSLQETFSLRENSAGFAGDFPEHGRYDWGLGGMLTMEDLDVGEKDGIRRWRRKGCLAWSGLPNLFWFIDRAAGLCGIYGGQVLPFGDVQTREMTSLFDKTMYERCGQHGQEKAKI